jgi:hypothetical protein
VYLFVMAVEMPGFLSGSIGTRLLNKPEDVQDSMVNILYFRASSNIYLYL